MQESADVHLGHPLLAWKDREWRQKRHSGYPRTLRVTQKSTRRHLQSRKREGVRGVERPTGRGRRNAKWTRRLHIGGHHAKWGEKDESRTEYGGPLGTVARNWMVKLGSHNEVRAKSGKD